MVHTHTHTHTRWLRVSICACIHMYIYKRKYICKCTYVYTHIRMCPPDQIIDLNSLPSSQISDFFYLSFSTNLHNFLRRIRCSWNWSPAQDYAVLILLLISVDCFVSARSIWSGGNILYHLGTSSQTRTHTHTHTHTRMHLGGAGPERFWHGA